MKFRNFSDFIVKNGLKWVKMAKMTKNDHIFQIFCKVKKF